jgi:pyrimidine-nucleoside phosphorylase
LFLVALGFQVPKLAVPGRPAGGIDSLSQIKGYKVQFEHENIISILHKSSYAHFLGTSEFAPIDKYLYDYRKKHDAVNIPELAIASLLSKKIAVGLKKIGLDIRVSSHGNFGKTITEARDNAKRFIKVASKLGIEAICYLTNGQTAYQPYIGRGEALLALKKTLENSCDEWLKKHVLLCCRMANTATGKLASSDNTYDSQKLKDIFESHLMAQGANYQSFIDTVMEVEQTQHIKLFAETDGFVKIDLQAIRHQIVTGQNLVLTPETPFPDPLGITLLKNTGDFVQAKEPVALIRKKSSIPNHILHSLYNSISVEKDENPPLFFEEVIHA